MLHFASFCLLLASQVSSEPVWLTDMRHCDLVVRGTVQSVIVELEPETEATPMLPRGDQSIAVPVAKITMRVEEVLRGEFGAGTLQFVAFVGISIFRSNYERGQETIVSLVWGEDVLGGSYWVYSDGARFLRSENGWSAQRGEAQMVDLATVKTSISRFEPDDVMGQADLVVLARIRDVRLETIFGENGSNAVQMSIDLHDARSLAGAVVPREITVRQITSGDYWPAWRDSAPVRDIPDKSESYCFFLKKTDDGYALVRGINGMYQGEFPRFDGHLVKSINS